MRPNGVITKVTASSVNRVRMTINYYSEVAHAKSYRDAASMIASISNQNNKLVTMITCSEIDEQVVGILLADINQSIFPPSISASIADICYMTFPRRYSISLSAFATSTNYYLPFCFLLHLLRTSNIASILKNHWERTSDVQLVCIETISRVWGAHRLG